MNIYNKLCYELQEQILKNLFTGINQENKNELYEELDEHLFEINNNLFDKYIEKEINNTEHIKDDDEEQEEIIEQRLCLMFSINGRSPYEIVIPKKKFIKIVLKIDISEIHEILRISDNLQQGTEFLYNFILQDRSLLLGDLAYNVNSIVNDILNDDENYTIKNFEFLFIEDILLEKIDDPILPNEEVYLVKILSYL